MAEVPVEAKTVGNHAFETSTMASTAKETIQFWLLG